ncbi:MAG: hypothetical protein CBHOC_5320 [uncultured Caballeronia sp.]|nr:MAG: hypothetical protein CBHOC_5320 [uncultured Caballeronia sp.]
MIYSLFVGAALYGLGSLSPQFNSRFSVSDRFLMADSKRIFNDPCEMEAYYSTLDVDVRICPASGSRFLYKEQSTFAADMLTVLSEIDTPCSLKARSDVDAYVVLLPAESELSVTSTSEGRTRSIQSTLIQDRLAVDRVTFHSPTKTTSFAISSANLHGNLACLLGTPCHGRLRFDHDSGLEEANVATLRHVAQALSATGERNDKSPGDAIVSSYLQQAFTTVILQGTRHNYSNQLRAIPSDVVPGRIKRAIDYMYANAGEPIVLAQIADAAALSVRGLQTGFMRHKEMSPMAFLRKVRLERAREDLLNSQLPAGCAEIAARWGFNNFHRFSKAYLTAFGESPQQTRAKIR